MSKLLSNYVDNPSSMTVAIKRTDEPMAPFLVFLTIADGPGNGPHYYVTGRSEAEALSNLAMHIQDGLVAKALQKKEIA